MYCRKEKWENCYKWYIDRLKWCITVSPRGNRRTFLHTLHQINKSKKVCISAVVTVVIVIVLLKFCKLSTAGLEELWLEFGVGVNQKWITVHWLEHSMSLPKWGAFRDVMH